MGIESRDVDGAMNRMEWPGVNKPIKLWSVRSDTNASVCPSGDQVGASLVPRAETASCAGLEPSMGATQILRSLVNATRAPSGAMIGVSPSATSFGDPPESATDHI